MKKQFINHLKSVIVFKNFKRLNHAINDSIVTVSGGKMVMIKNIIPSPASFHAPSATSSATVVTKGNDVGLDSLSFIKKKKANIKISL